MFNLSPLPFAPDALEPHISARTLEFHYGKHHQAYVDNLNKLIAGTEWEGKALEEIITGVNPLEQAAIFNNATQAYNHDFYWQSLSPAVTEPNAEISQLIVSSFGSLESLAEQFLASALSQFGSGWVWLVLAEGKLQIVKTSNADTPIAHGQKPLLAVDVWEHAYYLDYQNRRGDYAKGVIANLFNWDFAAKQLQK